MTREEIENTPKIVDFMLDGSVMADSRMKLHKRLEELCKLAIKALEQEHCEDAISRKDALQALCKAVHKNDTIPCPNQRVSCLWDKTKVQDYAEEILKLPSVQTKWISVSEKLPENNDNVLAWNGSCSMVAWYDAADDDWYSLDDRFVSRRPIKYWMPLPQEPKEVEK